MTKPEYAKELTEQYHQMSVPFTIVDGKTITGFAPQELDGILHHGPLA